VLSSTSAGASGAIGIAASLAAVIAGWLAAGPTVGSVMIEILLLLLLQDCQRAGDAVDGPEHSAAGEGLGLSDKSRSNDDDRRCSRLAVTRQPQARVCASAGV